MVVLNTGTQYVAKYEPVLSHPSALGNWEDSVVKPTHRLLVSSLNQTWFSTHTP